MLDVFILSFLRLFAFMKIKPHDGGLMKLSSSAVVWDEKRQSVFKQWVGTGAGQLWDWLGGYWPPMSSSCHLKGVTALQSLHPAKSTVGLLRMTLDWANHPPLWSSSLDGDAVPILFFFFWSSFNQQCLGCRIWCPLSTHHESKYSIGKSVSFILLLLLHS